jgi:REP element-mobilizing transposase RayT
MRRFPRTPPRLDRVIPNNPVFFVTACTYRRRPVLANLPVAATFVGFAERAYHDHNIAVGRYVIMPDHIHLFLCGPDDFELGRWMGMLKQCLEKKAAFYDQLRLTSPAGRRLQKRLAPGHPVWQRRFFDHVLRSDESYAQKWNYVRDNPVRAGLVTNADDWPYAGEIITIDRA